MQQQQQMQGELQEGWATNTNKPHWAVVGPHFIASLPAHRSLVSGNQSRIPSYGNSNSNPRETQAGVAPEPRAGLTFRCLNPDSSSAEPCPPPTVAVPLSEPTISAHEAWEWLWAAILTADLSGQRAQLCASAV